jgi:chaperonin GroES
VHTGKVIGVDAIQYFTKIPFIPHPDGGFYDVGFAWLLSPLNEAINTVINQLLDAGTLANTGGGFIGSGLRLKGGTIRFLPGQYQEVDVPGGTARRISFL